MCWPSGAIGKAKPRQPLVLYPSSKISSTTVLSSSSQSIRCSEHNTYFQYLKSAQYEGHKVTESKEYEQKEW